MNDKLRDEHINQLLSGILSLETVDECYAFFTDLCTISEVKSMAQRYQVAQLLKNGARYTDICADTGVSTATISRVNRCLEYGSDGYNLVLERMASRAKEQKENEPTGQSDD